jgi:hypothetical protein
MQIKQEKQESKGFFLASRLKNMYTMYIGCGVDIAESHTCSALPTSCSPLEGTESEQAYFAGC